MSADYSTEPPTAPRGQLPFCDASVPRATQRAGDTAHTEAAQGQSAGLPWPGEVLPRTPESFFYFRRLWWSLPTAALTRRGRGEATASGPQEPLQLCRPGWGTSDQEQRPCGAEGGCELALLRSLCPWMQSSAHAPQGHPLWNFLEGSEWSRRTQGGLQLT